MRTYNIHYNEVQHNDHCVLRVAGDLWNIGAMEWPIIYLWRFWPTCDISCVDMSYFRPDEYYEMWLQMMREEYPEWSAPNGSV